MARPPDPPTRSPVPAIPRAAAVLDLLIDRGATHLSEIARQLDLPKSSVSNLCSSMVEVGWVRRTDRGYVVGRRLVRYGQAYFGSLDPAGEFHRACDELGAALEYTAQLAMLTGDWEVTYIARRQGRRGVTVASELGQPLPAHCTGAGKALLAELPGSAVSDRAPIGPLPVLTRRSIRDLTELEHDLERTRRRGFAEDAEEVLEGVHCIARTLPSSGSVDHRLAVSVTLLKAHLVRDERQVVHQELDAIHTVMCQRLGLGGA